MVVRFEFQTDIHRPSLQKLVLLRAINDDKGRVIQKVRLGKARFCLFSMIRRLKTGVLSVQKVLSATEQCEPQLSGPAPALCEARPG